MPVEKSDRVSAANPRLPLRCPTMKRHLLLSFLLLSFVVWSGSAVSAQDRIPGINKNDFFPISVWYSGGKARAPMVSDITPTSRDEWKRDLQQIKDLGFNTVRTWVEWARSEPRPGAYDFSNLRLLLDLAGEVGLKVFIQVYVDSAPDWIAKVHPHTRFVSQAGYVVPPQSAPGYCTDNPEIETLVRDFYAAIARVASEYPHFYGWDLWSEPHVINWAIIDYEVNGQYCYCEGTQARFREWLQAKYGSLEAVNSAWSRRFEDWSEVEPPRFATILTYTDYMDWKMFIEERLADDLGKRDAAVRLGGSNHVTTSHAAVSAITQSPRNGTGSPDDFRMAHRVDYYGTSLYPKHNRPETHWPYWRQMSMMEFQRSVNIENGGWVVGELQAGMGTIGLWLSEPITPVDQRSWIWAAIGAGAKAINIYAYYPMSSGYESGGYGLINLDGTLTERAVEAGKLAQVVDANQDLLLASRPLPAKVGIVFNRLAQLVGGQRGGGDNYHDHLVGYYRAFAENNVPVEFVHREDLERDEVSQYDLLIVPYPLLMTRASAEGLKRYVEQGGRAVAEARLAWNDERGFASDITPGLGLHEVFGVREHEAWMTGEVEMIVDDVSHPALKRLEKGDVVRGLQFANTVRTLSPEARVLATINGEPAIVSSRYGKGETLFIGSFVGARNHQGVAGATRATAAMTTVNTGTPSAGAFEMLPENTAFILGLADWAGVKKPVTTTLDGTINPPLIARMHAAGDGYLLFLVSYNAESRRAGVEMAVAGDGAYRMRELITGEERSASAAGGRLRFDTEVSARGVQVWSISR